MNNITGEQFCSVMSKHVFKLQVAASRKETTLQTNLSHKIEQNGCVLLLYQALSLKEISLN